MSMRGRYYEELPEGSEFEHALTKTVTETDNLLITSLTLNIQPLHLDAEYAKASEHGQILVNSILTMGLIGAFAVPDLTLGTTVANLGFQEILLPSPVFIGDTLRARTVVTQVRASKSRPDCGIVWFQHIGLNQRDETVCVMNRSALMKRAPQLVEAGS